MGFGRNVLLPMVLTLGCSAGVGLAKRAEQGQPAPAKPPMPEIQSITVEPSSLTLQDGRDARQVLVWGVTSDGRRFDLSDDAKLTSDSPVVRVGEDRFVVPGEAGEGTVTVAADGKEAKLAVKVLKAGELPVRFTRDVMPVLASVGCNAGTCHGAAKGKNGFKLSLRGYDAEYDYNALVNELQGRRVNRVDPAKSLMLLKPTGIVPHEGGHVLETSGRRYDIILQWIKEGARYEPDPGSARPNSVEVLPKEVALDLPGRTQRLIVLAHYADGTVRDVTRDAVLSSNSIDVAKITGNEITGLARGEAAILVRYEGNYGVQNPLWANDCNAVAGLAASVTSPERSLLKLARIFAPPSSCLRAFVVRQRSSSAA